MATDEPTSSKINRGKEQLARLRLGGKLLFTVDVGQADFIIRSNREEECFD
jgi:hypothetical protein